MTTKPRRRRIAALVAAVVVLAAILVWAVGRICSQESWFCDPIREVFSRG